MIWLIIVALAVGLATWLILRVRNRKCRNCDFYCSSWRHCWLRGLTVGPEDERIRKELIETIRCISDDCSVFLSEQQRDRYLDWLEKQKDKEKYDRMAPIYNDQQSFEDALDKAWEFYQKSGSSTVDGCEDSPVELAFAKGFREGFLCGKQKESHIPWYDYQKSKEAGYTIVPNDEYEKLRQKEQKPLRNLEIPAENESVVETADSELEKELNAFLCGYDREINEEEIATLTNVAEHFYQLGKQEKKPISQEDMPYIADEHFFEREPVDSFRYKLAEYMTRGCTKKEGPYGHTYAISAESILQMAKEELLKRGVVQKPAEWSEEDKEAFDMCIDAIPKAWKTKSGILLTKWLKDNIHMQSKQEWSEEDEETLEKLHRLLVICRGEKKFIQEADYYKMDNLLKSLRPQPKRDCKDCAMFLNGKCTKPHWKPSDVCYGAKGDPDPAGVWKPSEEQMKALEECGECKRCIKELYEQLKSIQ